MKQASASKSSTTKVSYVDRLFSHRFDNGLLLVADRMPWLHSVAFSIALPAGCRFDPSDQPGLCNLACELAFRETKTRNSRDLVESLDGLGCDYYSNTSVMCTFFGGALPAELLYEALPIYSEVVQQPGLSPQLLEEARMTCIQEVESLEDDLAGRAMSRLRMVHYGDPWGRIAEGTVEGLNSVGLSDVEAFVRHRYVPEGAVIAVAGQFDFDRLCGEIGRMLGDWQALEKPPLASETQTRDVGRHIQFPSKQTHIAIAWPGIPYESPDWPLARAAIGVLSDGMSSRLFNEVREKRGLCYSVMANCHAIPGRGSNLAYCGTTTEAAQRSLDVMLEQFRLLEKGITPDELRRLKTQVRSGLVMQQESCRSRVSSLVNDSLMLGRLRTVDELSERINAIGLEEMNSWLAAHPAGPFDIVTLGERPLETDSAISATKA